MTTDHTYAEATRRVIEALQAENTRLRRVIAELRAGRPEPESDPAGPTWAEGYNAWQARMARERLAVWEREDR